MGEVGGRGKDMEFPGGLKKQNLETPGVNKKRSGISRHDQEKNSVEFPGAKLDLVWNLQG